MNQRQKMLATSLDCKHLSFYRAFRFLRPVISHPRSAINPTPPNTNGYSGVSSPVGSNPVPHSGVPYPNRSKSSASSSSVSGAGR